MELDFKKEKERIADLTDAELIARIRDPAISSTDRMLIEAEISRRGLDRHRKATTQSQPAMTKPRRGSKLLPILIMAGILTSIIAGALEDMGIDIIQWLRDLFSNGN